MKTNKNTENPAVQNKILRRDHYRSRHQLPLRFKLLNVTLKPVLESCEAPTSPTDGIVAAIAAHETQLPAMSPWEGQYIGNGGQRGIHGIFLRSFFQQPLHTQTMQQVLQAVLLI